MKKFEFRLQRVLEIKQHREEQRKKELAFANSLLRQEEKTMEALMSERTAYFNRVKDKTMGKTRAAELLIYYNYLEVLQEMLSAQESKIYQLTTDVERKRDLLVEASQERKILENLKQRKMAEYWEDIRKSELAFIDEIAHRNPKLYRINRIIGNLWSGEKVTNA